MVKVTPTRMCQARSHQREIGPRGVGWPLARFSKASWTVSMLSGQALAVADGMRIDGRSYKTSDTSSSGTTLIAMDPLFELALGLKAVSRELERLANEAMRPLGLTGAQADALVVIGQAGPL